LVQNFVLLGQSRGENRKCGMMENMCLNNKLHGKGEKYLFLASILHYQKSANKLLFPPKKITAQKSGYFFVT
jgi:hypothetical protein